MRKKILFVVNKYGNRSDPTSPTPDHDHGGLISSFIETDLAEFDIIYYDAFCIQTKNKVDNFLKEKANRCDAVVMLYVHWMPQVPELTTLREIALSKPIAYIWYDAVNDAEKRACERLAETSTINVFMDTSDYPNIEKTKILHLWFPRDSRVYFKDASIVRSVDVSWLGSVSNYGERSFYLQALETRDIPIWIPKNRLSNKECCDIWRRSKIGLNFSGGVDPNKRQFKTRIIEVISCGAMLLESRNNEITKWFVEGRDYVSFKEPEELFDKIDYYLKHEDQRNEIAANAHEKVRKIYNSENYWQEVLRRLI